MSLPDRFDYWSPPAALLALALLAVVVFARPAFPVAVALALGVVVFGAGVLVPIREAIPSYNRLLGVYCGVFGLAGLAAEGWRLDTAAMLLVGVVSALELAYERVTGRSADVV